MKTNIKIILAVILVFAGIVLFEQHQDAQRAEYARVNNCTWVVSGSHDICR